MTRDAAKWEHVSHPYEDGEPCETFADYEDWQPVSTDSRQEAPDAHPATARDPRA